MMRKKRVVKHRCKRILSAILTLSVALTTTSVATLMYSSAEDIAKVTKSAAWTENYQEDGKATITLEAHDPLGGGSVTTVKPIDVTVILDRSASMHMNNTYSSACQAAQKAFDALGKSYSALTSSELDSIGDAAMIGAYYSAGNKGVVTEDMVKHSHWDASCMNQNHKSIVKLIDMGNRNDPNSLEARMRAYINSERGKSKGAFIVDEASKLSRFVVGNGLYVSSNSLTVNGVWCSLEVSGGQAAVLNLWDFQTYCDEMGWYNADQPMFHHSYGHLMPNSEGKFQCITDNTPVYFYDGNERHEIKYSNGNICKVYMRSNYMYGCNDYLGDTQDGLQNVINKVFDGNANSKIGYMQFGNNASMGGSVFYNNKQYYAASDKDKLLDDMITYRKPESTERTEANLTPWRVKNNAGTVYMQGLTDAVSQVNELKNPNSTHLVLFVSDGAPDDGEGNLNKYNPTIKSIMDTIKGKGVSDVYFDTVGINLTDDQASYLKSMAEYADSIEDVEAKYSGEYIDIKDPTQLGEKIDKIIENIASVPAVYTDKLSNYFEFPQSYSEYKLTISENADYSDAIVVTQSDDVSFDGDTVTWKVPDPKKYSKLEFTMKLKNQYMETGTGGLVLTNSSATFESGDRTWSDQKTDEYKIDKPKLEFSVGDPKVAKSAAWTQNYEEDGKATITLEAHDPNGSGTTEQILPVDMTVILDNSPSMYAKRSYNYAAEVASAAAKAGKTANEIYAATANSIPGQTYDDLNNTQLLTAFCGCLGSGHKYIYKMYGLRSDARNALVQYEKAQTTAPTKASEVKCLSISSYDVAQKWLGNFKGGDNSKIVDYNSGSFFLAGEWCEFSGDVNNFNRAVIVDLGDFLKWCADNNISVSRDYLLERSYIHLAPNASDDSFDLLSHFETVMYQDASGNLVPVKNSEGKELKVIAPVDYEKGCTDYLSDAEDGLEGAIKTVYSNEDSKIGFMRFGSPDSSTIYNNGNYYASSKVDELREAILSHRLPDTKQYTPERIHLASMTSYDKGLTDSLTIANNLSNANDKHIVLFVSDGSPSGGLSQDYYNNQVLNLMNKIKDNGAKEIYFNTVGINLSANDAKYLIGMADYADGIEGVDAKYSGDYLDITDTTKFGQEIKKIITSIAKTPATYTDKLSNYFEFPQDSYEYKLTISDNEDYSDAIVVTQSDDVAFDGDTVTWTVPDPKKYSKLEFTVKLKDQYMKSGTGGLVPTNSLATFESGDKVWSDQKTDEYKIDKPQLEYVAPGDPKVKKSAAWNDDYLTSGKATITLEAHDPRGGGSVTTVNPVDVTVILDRSSSMHMNNTYSFACEAAQKAFDALGKSYSQLTPDELDSIGNTALLKAYNNLNKTLGVVDETMVTSSSWDASCQNPNHKSILKLGNSTNPASVEGRIREYIASERGQSKGAFIVDDASKYSRFVPSDGLKIGSTSMTVNSVWCSLDVNGGQAAVLNLWDFQSYCDEKGYTESLEAVQPRYHRTYGHVIQNSDGKYELVSKLIPVRIYDGNEVHEIKFSNGNICKVHLHTNYADGCVDYLVNTQDGLENTINQVFDGNANSKVAYMQFGNSAQNGGSVFYNNKQYYTFADKDKLLNDMITYRNPGNTARTEENLTPWRVKNSAGTVYMQGLMDAITQVNALTNPNTTHLVLFVSDGGPDDSGGNVNKYNSTIKTLMDTVKSKGASNVYFDTVGINLTDDQSIYLKTMADYANSLEGVNAKYAGEYVDVKDPAKLGEKIDKIIHTISSVPATFTDTLSEYFDFSSVDGYEITVSDNEDYSEGTTITTSPDVTFDGNKVTWNVQEPKKYNKLTFTVKLKDMKNLNSAMGVLGKTVETNESARFEASQTWDLPNPELNIPLVKKSLQNATLSELVANGGKFKLVLDARDANAETGVYTDVLSQYVEFANATPVYTVTNAADTVSFDGKTITWNVANTKLDNKLIVDVKLTQEAMNTGVTDVFTNSSAKFVTSSGEWNDSIDSPDPRHIDKPTVSYKNTGISCVKTLEWVDNTGVAKVTVSPKVTGNSGPATYTDSIDTTKFDIYSTPATATSGTFNVSGDSVSWNIPNLTSSGETFTYYIKLKDTHQNVTLDDNKEGTDGAKLVFDSKTYVEEGVGSDPSLSIIPTPNLDVVYNPLKVKASVTDVSRPDAGSVTYTVKDATTSFNVTVNGSNATGSSEYVDWNNAGTFTFGEYKGTTKMESSDILTVTEVKKSFVAEQKSTVSGKSLTTEILEKGTGSASVTVEFKNDYTVVRTNLKIKKVDSSGMALKGAVYTLYENGPSGKVLATNLETNSKGEVTYNGKLEIGKTYCIVETKAPDGYELKAEEMTFVATVTPSGNLSYSGREDNTLTYKVVNIKTSDVIDIPATGGVGLYVVVGAGLLMMLVAAGYLIISRRKHSDDSKN